MKIRFLMVLLLCSSFASQASFYTFNQYDDFANQITALSLSSQQLHFDEMSAGQIIGSDDVLQSSFRMSLIDPVAGIIDAVVSDSYDTTSAHNYFGRADSDDGSLYSGDNIEFLFEQPIWALGFYIIASPGDMGFMDDAILSNEQGAVSNSELPQTTLSDGGDVFFLGLIDTNGFSFASLSTICCEFFQYNLDDVIWATEGDSTPDVPSVSAPSGLAILFTFLLGWVFRHRTRHVKFAE